MSSQPQPPLLRRTAGGALRLLRGLLLFIAMILAIGTGFVALIAALTSIDRTFLRDEQRPAPRPGAGTPADLDPRTP